MIIWNMLFDMDKQLSPNYFESQPAVCQYTSKCFREDVTRIIDVTRYVHHDTNHVINHYGRKWLETVNSYCYWYLYIYRRAAAWDIANPIVFAIPIRSQKE